MTRKHYQMIAGAIASQRIAFPASGDDFAHNAALTGAAYAIARQLEADNPLFDHARFYQACGLDVLGAEA